MKFVTDKLKSANWLIQTIEQRRQHDDQGDGVHRGVTVRFLREGAGGASSPLTLQDVAEKIGMHESTVSRVTTNKYVQSPRGVLPLKYFFSSGLDTESGQTVSSKMAMERIQAAHREGDTRRNLSPTRRSRSCSEGRDLS